MANNNKSRKEKKEPISFNISGNIISTTQTIQSSPRKKFDLLDYKSGIDILEAYKEKYKNKLIENGDKSEESILKNNTSKSNLLNDTANENTSLNVTNGNHYSSNIITEENIFYQPINQTKLDEKVDETDENKNTNTENANIILDDKPPQVGKAKKLVFI